MGADARPAFYNFPFIRVFSEGVPWVTIFLVLTGFVNALKPIKQARAGRVDSALSGLSSSCFRRISRLVLPCTAATFFSWIIAELGGYNIGTMVESAWMNGTSLAPDESLSGAVRQLFQGIYDTWTVANNALDRNQWTMLWFLRGSLTLYVTLLATVRATSKYRMIIHTGLFCYAWSVNDSKLSCSDMRSWRLTNLNSYGRIANLWRSSPGRTLHGAGHHQIFHRPFDRQPPHSILYATTWMVLCELPQI
jgi:hypothetical protein